MTSVGQAKKPRPTERRSGGRPKSIYNPISGSTLMDLCAAVASASLRCCLLIFSSLRYTYLI